MAVRQLDNQQLTIKTNRISHCLMVYLDDVSAALTSLGESKAKETSNTDVSKMRGASARSVQFVHPLASGEI